MAGTSRQIRRSVSPDGKKGIFKGQMRLGATFDAAVVLAVAVAVAIIVFGFQEEARRAIKASLYFGWVPVGVWALSLLVALRYRPRFLVVHWRWWVGAAALSAITIGILSLFRPGDDLLFGASLGGRWGPLAVGPMWLGVLKLLAIAILVPLLLFPKNVAHAYMLVLKPLGRALQLAATYFLMVLAFPVYYLGGRLRVLFDDDHRRLLILRLQRMTSRVAPSRTEAESYPAVVPEFRPERDYSPLDESDDFDVPNDNDIGLDDSPDRLTPTPLKPVLLPPDRSVGGDVRVLSMVGQSQWQIPSLDLLDTPEPHDTDEAPLQEMARHIESTLSEHGVEVEVKDIKAGPRIVRFGLVPGWVARRGEAAKGESPRGGPERSRVKVQSILTREKDLALALKTPYLRIEAPVPGEALVGLEVPTPTPTKVSLRGVMDDAAFRKIAAKGGLPVALGEDTGGNPVVTDLAALPHLLIAGATGSGKSVCINSLIASLLLTKPPDQLRLLMVDPKRVELTPFNGIPHLITPVIVDTEEVNPALRGLMREMFRRYKQMEELGTRNIAGYNAKVGEAERMPFLVLVVDELADLMMVAGFEVEQNLVRLAQLGRATGIHLVLATQRPSVNVVTGLLKANIAARVAFAVASQIDSRVILDTVGAEKLLGRGDMLLLNSESPKPRRVQGNLINDDEIDKLVEFWLEQKGPPLPEISIEDVEDNPEDPDTVDESTMDKARELALRNPHLSTSLLERRLKIGGRRATQIIEMLEEEGLVIPS